MTHVRRTFAFFAANVASERKRLPNGNQWVVMEFSFHDEWYSSACDVKVEVATGTSISVFIFIFFAEYAIAKLYVFAIIYLFGRENKRMD